jgi:putative ABC transport system permease protein
MISYYLKTAIRNIWKHKAFAIITIFGLTIAMAICIMLSAHVMSEYNYDKFWNNSENIYRVKNAQYMNGAFQFESATTYNALPYAMEKEFPEVKYATGIAKDVITIYTPEIQVKDVNMYWTDTCIFKVFQCTPVYGSLQNPFPDIHSVVISKSLSKSLYGDINPVGKRFKLNEGWEYRVTAVFDDIPENSHIIADCFFDFKSLIFNMRNFDYTTRQMQTELSDDPQNTRNGNFRRTNTYVYALLNKNTSAENVNNKFEGLLAKYAPQLKESGLVLNYKLQPITDIHLNSKLNNEISTNGNKDLVLALIIIACIIICIAWINFVNLTLVRGLEHSKTTGINKIVGAQRVQVLYQYLIENLLLNAVSIILALALLFVLKPLYLNLIGIHLNLSFQWQHYLYFIFAIIVGILISGLYPAIILSAFKPVELFSNLKQRSGRSIDLRKALVIAQFTATIILIVGTCTVYRQVNFMQNQELGINIEQTLVSFSPMSTIRRPDLVQKLHSFKNEIGKLPNVKNVTTSSSIPGKEIEQIRNTNVYWAKKSENETGQAYYFINTDEDFFATYEIELLAGQLYDHTDGTPQTEIVINEEASRNLGFSSAMEAIGEPVKIGSGDFYILGVVANHHHEMLSKPLAPIIFQSSYRWNHMVGYYSFKVVSNDIPTTITDIKAVWMRFYPNDHFDFFFLDEAFNAQYSQYKIFGKLFGAFSLLAIIIACSGLLGLAMYAATKRQKEIGVRKVNGARISEVLLMLNRDFIKWVAIAFVIATPLAYYAMHLWLENFAYKTTLSWWIFALAGLLALGIALLTVSWQSWRAATRNPVEALRYE